MSGNGWNHKMLHWRSTHVMPCSSSQVTSSRAQFIGKFYLSALCSLLILMPAIQCCSTAKGSTTCRPPWPTLFLSVCALIYLMFRKLTKSGRITMFLWRLWRSLLFCNVRDSLRTRLNGPETQCLQWKVNSYLSLDIFLSNTDPSIVLQNGPLRNRSGRERRARLRLPRSSALR